ncbi:MAG: hypothetical protein JSR85_08755 [Proteobacteria bacterium]|nr:hypothetical protein [Pseudomonadota bacterium]
MHTYRISQIKISFLLFTFLIGIQPLQGMVADDSDLTRAPVTLKESKPEDEAMSVLRTRPLVYEALASIFEKILRPKTSVLFETYFKIMFHSDFPPPVHPDEKILNGFQCLYRKMAHARTVPDEKEQERLQQEALFQLMAFHKHSISTFDQTLADKVPGFGCPSCQESARTEIGLTAESDHPEY